MRNNVLFASLIEEFSNDDEKLISWCIQELSKQIFEFYSLIKTTPENIYKENLKSIRQSFRLFNSSIGFENSILSDSQNKNDQKETMNNNSINNNSNNNNSFYNNPFNFDINSKWMITIMTFRIKIIIITPTNLPLKNSLIKNLKYMKVF